MERSKDERYYYTAYVRPENANGLNFKSQRILRTRSHERGIIRMLHGVIRLSAEGWFKYDVEDLVNTIVVLEKEFEVILKEKDLEKRKVLFDEYKVKLKNKPFDDLGVNIK